jgi:hypothetical protein
MALKRAIASNHVDTVAPFEPTSLTPHVEKYLADHVLRGSLIANETNDKPKHPHVVTRKQHLHGEPVAVRDPSDQHLVWCRLHSDSSL